MNIGIIGQGFVGNAIYQKLKKYYKVFTYDIQAKLCNSDLDEVLNRCKIIFVCVPTPMNKDGSCNLDILDNTLDTINKASMEIEDRIVVIKSTIIPGSTHNFQLKYRYIDLVFNPEFLTEANAVDDFENQTRLLLGGPKRATTKIKQIFSAAFRKTPRIIKTDAKTAELVNQSLNREIPIHKNWRLNERHYGDLTGLNKLDAKVKFGEEKIQEWRRGYHTPPPPISPENNFNPNTDDTYANVPKESIPLTECLADVVDRLIPYWNSDIWSCWWVRNSFNMDIC